MYNLHTLFSNANTLHLDNYHSHNSSCGCQRVKAPFCCACSGSCIALRHTYSCSISRWLLEGLWHGIVCFFVPLLALGQSRRNGTVDGIFSYGVATYTALIIITNLKVSLVVRSMGKNQEHPKTCRTQYHACIVAFSRH